MFSLENFALQRERERAFREIHFESQYVGARSHTTRCVSVSGGQLVSSIPGTEETKTPVRDTEAELNCWKECAVDEKCGAWTLHHNKSRCCLFVGINSSDNTRKKFVKQSGKVSVS